MPDTVVALPVCYADGHSRSVDGGCVAAADIVAAGVAGAAAAPAATVVDADAAVVVVAVGIAVAGGVVAVPFDTAAPLDPHDLLRVA